MAKASTSGKAKAPPKEIDTTGMTPEQIAAQGKKSARAKIYVICDPRDGEIRYIGKANDPEKRFDGHLRETRRRTPLYDWIGKLRSEGLIPTMRVLCSAISDNWQDLERQVIAQGRSAGLRLLNVAEGGDEPHCAAEVRSNNGRMLVERLAADPKLARLARNKRILASSLRRGTIGESTKAKMRLAAAKYPHLFGEWAAI